MSTPVASSVARVAFGRLAVGVAIVTALDGDAPHGATGMAWAEHASPPLVLTTLRTSGRTRALVAQVGGFGVNVLAEGQESSVRTFAARSVVPGDRFDEVPWSRGAALGLPLLDGCAVTMECEVRDIHPFGGHDIVVGEAVSMTLGQDVRPVVHYDGGLLPLRRDET